MSIKITNQHKNYWPLSYMWHTYNFMQLQYKSLPNLPKNVGKRTQMAYNTYNWLFFLSLTTLPCGFWSWKKTKTIISTFIKQTLLIFMKYSMSLSNPLSFVFSYAIQTHDHFMIGLTLQKLIWNLISCYDIDNTWIMFYVFTSVLLFVLRCHFPKSK